MKAAIVGAASLNSFGGNEVLINRLKSQLESLGMEVSEVYLEADFSNRQSIVNSILNFQRLDLSKFDFVICLRFPAYFVRHPRKIVWLLHQFRPLMDLWGTHFGYGKTLENSILREQVLKLEFESLSNLKNRLRVNSKITQSRLLISTGIDSKILVCPLSQNLKIPSKIPAELSNFRENFIFMGGRISPEKRQSIAIEAARRSKVPLVIAGMPDNNEYVNSLKEKLSGTNSFLIDRKLESSELAWLYENSHGVLYLPLNEDSYGYVLGEAASFGKNLVTAEDSGDAVEFVQLMGGVVTKANSEDLSYALRNLLERENSGEDLHVLDKWKSFEPSWGEVREWIQECIA